LQHQQQANLRRETKMSILWIVLVVIVVLALFGYVGRGRRRAL
jgi:uncharacterized membrane protein